jgi:glucokinase
MKKPIGKTIKSEIVLAGDVGGTKTRLGLFEGWRISSENF